jgi:Uma2 family endonuclease
MIEGSEHHYTLEEFWRLVETFPEHKYEYVNGYVRMMTGGTPAHSQIAVNISTVLNMGLDESECNVYGSDAMVQLNNDRIYYPDVSVSCDPRDWTEKKALQSPGVVVEVLSPSTERIDKNEKLAAYQSYPAIQDILLVDSRCHYVEHYHRIAEREWNVKYYKNDEDVVYLECIDVSLSVGRIYRKVYLELED